MRGLVIKNTGSWYLVKTDEGKCVECKIKGNFRLKGIRSTNPVAVGDYVQIILNPEGTAFISEIEDRKNYIIRRASNLSKQSHILAANLDQSMLIVTVNYPETSTTFIDRFLASAEAYRVPVKLIFNKIDAYDEDEQQFCTRIEPQPLFCFFAEQNFPRHYAIPARWKCFLQMAFPIIPPTRPNTKQATSKIGAIHIGIYVLRVAAYSVPYPSVSITI